MMSYGFDPYLSTWSPYHGAIYAVTESIAKIVAAGGDYSKIRFTFQEYFRRMTEDPHRWSQPFAALLGAYSAQLGYGLPSIGGKDSMSGTFEHIDVPPTLVSFAVDIAKEKTLFHRNLRKPEINLYGFALRRIITIFLYTERLWISMVSFRRYPQRQDRSSLCIRQTWYRGSSQQDGFR